MLPSRTPLCAHSQSAGRRRRLLDLQLRLLIEGNQALPNLNGSGTAGRCDNGIPFTEHRIRIHRIRDAPRCMVTTPRISLRVAAWASWSNQPRMKPAVRTPAAAITRIRITMIKFATFRFFHRAVSSCHSTNENRQITGSSLAPSGGMCVPLRARRAESYVLAREQGKPMFGYLSLTRSIRIERQRRAAKAPPSRKGEGRVLTPSFARVLPTLHGTFVYFCVRFFFYLRSQQSCRSQQAQDQGHRVQGNGTVIPGGRVTGFLSGIAGLLRVRRSRRVCRRRRIRGFRGIGGLCRVRRFRRILLVPL